MPVSSSSMVHPRKRARESSPATESSSSQVHTKLSAFEERYKTATRSNEDVLSKTPLRHSNYFLFFDILFLPYRSTTQKLDLALLSPLQGANYNCGKQRRKVSICLSHVSVCILFYFCSFDFTSRLGCNRNPSIILTRKREEDSTTNLVRHVKSCESQVVDPSKSIASYAQGSTYNKAQLRYLISRWVFECHRPFSIIDDPPLQRILKMLYAKVETPSSTTVSRDIKEIHTISKVHVGRFLQVCFSYHFLSLRT